MTISTGQVAYASDVLALPIYTASDYVLLASASGLRTVSSGAYYRVKEIILPGSGTFRIKFDLYTDASRHTIWGRVYRNGVAIGTEQTETSSTSVTKSEDIAGWYPGDFCQLYAHASAAEIGGQICDDFKIYSDTNKSDFQVTRN